MTPQSYIQVLSVQVAAERPWQPHLALHLMQALYAFDAPLTLNIRAAPLRIRWQIEAPSLLTAAITDVLRALFPDLRLAASAKRQADVGVYRYALQTVEPFFLPLQTVTEAGGTDVLAGIVATFAHLAEDEMAVYSLELHPPSQDYHAVGRNQINPGDPLWMRLMGTGRRSGRSGLLGEAGDWDRFARTLQTQAEQKIGLPLKEVVWTVKIRAATQGRADRLFGLLQPALGRLENPGVNRVRPPEAGGRYRLVLTAAETALLWHLPTSQMRTLGIEWAGQPEVALPLEVTTIQDGLRLGSTVYQGRTFEVQLATADRVTHVNLIGRTRMGKSTLLHHLIHQDIAAGRGVGVIDPHGDLVEDILHASIPPARAADVVLFDLDEEKHIIGLNLLAESPGVAVETNASLVLAVLRKYFADQLAEGSRMEDTLYAALVALMSVPGSVLQDVTRLFADPTFREKVLAHVEDPVALDFWRLEYDRASEGQRQVLAQPINHRIRRLYRDRRMRRIIGASTCLDFRHILDHQKIFLVNLRGSNSLEGDTLGALLIAKLQMAAMGRSRRRAATRTPFYLYVDEVQNFVTTSLATLLSESAKFGLSLTIANQFLAQLEGKTLNAVLGNVGTNIVFRCGNEEAKLFAPLLGGDFDVTALTNLDRFRAAVKTQVQGKTLPAFLIDTDPPRPQQADAAALAAQIRQLSRERYGTSVAVIDAELRARYAAAPAGSQDLPATPDEMDYFD